MMYRLRLQRTILFGLIAGMLAMSFNNIAPPLAQAAGTITGTAFRDLDGDGTKDAAEVGEPGITVTAYDASGAAQGTATTIADGTYSLTATGTGPYRIEFSGWASGLQPGAFGAQDATSVQFVADGNQSKVDFAVNNPGDFCEANPLVCTTVFSNGTPNNNGWHKSIVSVHYNDAGETPDETQVADKVDTGSVWGLAYSRTGQKLYSASFVKRHVGMYESPAGTTHPGEIFVSDVSSLAGGTAGATTPFIDLANYGASVGTVPSNAARGLGAKLDASADATVFDLVGKVGLGDIDISTDESTLWTVSLNDKKLFKIVVDADNNPATTPAAADVTGFAIPDPGCTGGAWRPFATKYANDAVYVGGVCDAETSQSAADLHAYIYKFDVATSTFTQVFSDPLSYNKPAAAPYACPTIKGWYPWAATFDTLNTPNCYPGTPISMEHPTPMLTDIEFDVDGSLILGFVDRGGHQTGPANYNTSGTGNYEYYEGGDVIRACPNNTGGWTLENAGKCNGVGPGGAEWYSGEEFTNTVGGALLHAETSNGGLALKPGSGEVIVSAMDPVDGGGEGQISGGLLYLNNTTGKKDHAYRIYNNGDTSSLRTLGKSAGIGDVEILYGLAPIEIGNRVWKDLNNNGIQDPGEPPIAGVTVQLADAAGTLITGATAVTDANGNYYFSSAIGTSTTSAIYGLPIKANTGYKVQIDTTQSALSGLNPTKADADTTTNGDSRDSDGILAGTTDAVAFTTGSAGANNHTFDFGFNAPPLSLGNLVWNDTNNNGLKDTTEPGIDGVKVNLFIDTDASGTLTAGDTPAGSMATSNGGHYLFTNLAAATYLVQIAPSNFATGGPLAGYTSSTGVNGAATGPYEPGKTGTTDNDDNGTIGTGGLATTGPTGGIVSGPVVLGLGTAPTDETDLGLPTGITNPAANADSDLSIDFGVFQPASLGDYVWFDTNKNGIQDATEVGVNGVQVSLYTPNGKDGIAGNEDDILPLATFITGDNPATTATETGYYHFGNLAPNTTYTQARPRQRLCHRRAAEQVRADQRGPGHRRRQGLGCKLC